ncbi:MULTISPECIES: hypothetical protein [unclassified Leucobacter]|uniref:hypothetical protein n=1 Tax=unclassified Leucobacter TaxID=2621730 RepID=UPI00165E39AB|nr:MULTISPECIES: hypothetical protein [unclassified Leucobacter]MBC9927461.1 hypothetical protein [Leucobacter sp. cx-169]MBC9936515.1 hypothetical protein [Leucobacter sp. cx-87]
MSAAPELLRQGAQRLGKSCSIGFIGSTLRTTDAGGGLAARLGISGPDGRKTVELAAGETAPLPAGGTLRVLEIFLSPDGTKAAAAIEVHEGAEPSA